MSEAPTHYKKEVDYEKSNNCPISNARGIFGAWNDCHFSSDLYHDYNCDKYCNAYDDSGVHYECDSKCDMSCNNDNQLSVYNDELRFNNPNVYAYNLNVLSNHNDDMCLRYKLSHDND